MIEKGQKYRIGIYNPLHNCRQINEVRVVKVYTAPSGMEFVSFKTAYGTRKVLSLHAFKDRIVSHEPS